MMPKSPFIHSKTRDLCCLHNAAAQFPHQLLATIMKLKWKEFLQKSEVHFLHFEKNNIIQITMATKLS